MNCRTSTDEDETPTATSMSNVVAAVESGDFYLDDVTSMVSTLFWRICLNGNQNRRSVNR